MHLHFVIVFLSDCLQICVCIPFYKTRLLAKNLALANKKLVN